MLTTSGPAGDSTLLVSLRDLFDAVSEDGPFGGAADPITGLPYKLQDRMPVQTLRDCIHWVNHPQVGHLGQSQTLQMPSECTKHGQCHPLR